MADMIHRIIDKETGLVFPYYTHNFLEQLNQWDIKNWRVFEYGGGDSTDWWRRKAKECISVDTDIGWATAKKIYLETDKDEFLRYPNRFIQDEKDLFDCIIIDSQPAEWRDDCTEFAIKYLKRYGILIIDNWLQDSIPKLRSTNWVKSKEILKYYDCKIFQQPNHKDWKTAYWIIT